MAEQVKVAPRFMDEVVALINQLKDCKLERLPISDKPDESYYLLKIVGAPKISIDALAVRLTIDDLPQTAKRDVPVEPPKSVAALPKTVVPPPRPVPIEPPPALKVVVQPPPRPAAELLPAPSNGVPISPRRTRNFMKATVPQGPRTHTISPRR